jgi:threonine synthase
MKLYSTKDKNHIVDLEQSVMKSLAPDGGLYMPCQIPVCNCDFLENLPEYSFQDISYEVAKNLIGSDDISNADLRSIIEKAIDFMAPVKMLDDQIGSLELWHGPSLAFKDFGARFMAGLMSYFLMNKNQKTTILVATSGDTGGAVAAGFYNVPGIEIIILYPSGKVSDLQEKQLTTLGKNISAVEVNGTFDDCQAMVKQAFLDSEINKLFNLSSANSINIARLIPQSFYYFEAYKQVMYQGKDVVFTVPSGNFGNLTAGLLSKKMGLPIKRFIAATNANNIFPSYLESGHYEPRPSIQTISNAMDVGDPSNFPRILELYNHDLKLLKDDVSGFWLSDIDTKSALKEAYQNHNYLCDPHGAIGYKSLENLESNELGIFLETAHPAKFLDVMGSIFDHKIEVPYALSSLQSKTKVAKQLSSRYTEFRDYLLEKS